MKAQELKNKRSQKGLTQSEFAQLIGYDFETVAKWEQGKIKISKRAAILISKA